MGLKDKARKGGKRDGEAPKIKFGRLYRDYITGFEGRCTGFASFISGCDQVLIVPRVDKDGKHQHGHWFDDDRLIDVKLDQKVERTSTRGGPQYAPSRTD
ncbi:MAG: hypothetical protein ACLQQB_00655 [Solirubrobacteraceae bacterium]